MAAKKIALDAGHGLKTAGKQTPNGIKEWELNDKVRDKVVENLKNYDVEFIFPDNNEGNVDEGLTKRRTMYINADADAAVSIHHNAYTGTWNNATGVEVFVDRNATAKDKELATLIYNNMVKEIGLRGRGIKEADFTVINQDSIPACLTEGGFMDGIEDYKIITTDEGQAAYAKAISDALIVFLELEKKTTTTSKGGNIVNIELNVLKKGAKGEQVKTLQRLLIAMGYSCGSSGVDGSFGSATDAAVRKYQKDHSLAVDGSVGKNTWTSLLK